MEIVTEQKGSLVLELQQRSIEFNSIIQKHDNIKLVIGQLLFSLRPKVLSLTVFCDIYFMDTSRNAVVERMPVLDEAAYIEKRAATAQSTVSSEKTSKPTTAGVAALNLPNGVKAVSAAPLVDLLDLTSDDIPAPSSSSNDFLQDILRVGLTPEPSTSGFYFNLILLSIHCDYFQI